MSAHAAADRYDNIVSVSEKEFAGGGKDRKFVHDGIVMNVDRPEEGSSTARIAAPKSEIGDEPLTGIGNRIAYRFIKRTFDIVFSVFVLVVFWWLFAIIAIAIKIDDPKGPVIFKQERIGKDGKPFTMYKFRSMCVNAEDKLADLRELNEKTGPVFKMAEDPRITRVGKVIRKLSLDELPQFVNVLRGNIALMGPGLISSVI